MGLSIATIKVMMASVFFWPYVAGIACMLIGTLIISLSENMDEEGSAYDHEFNDKIRDGDLSFSAGLLLDLVGIIITVITVVVHLQG